MALSNPRKEEDAQQREAIQVGFKWRCENNKYNKL